MPVSKRAPKPEEVKPEHLEVEAIPVEPQEGDIVRRFVPGEVKEEAAKPFVMPIEEIKAQLNRLDPDQKLEIFSDLAEELGSKADEENDETDAISTEAWLSLTIARAMRDKMTESDETRQWVREAWLAHIESLPETNRAGQHVNVKIAAAHMTRLLTLIHDITK